MWLYQIRQTTLDEIMIPTEEEIKRMSRLNDKLLDLTHQLYAKVSELWKVMNDSELHLMITTAWRVPLNISGTMTDRL